MNAAVPRRVTIGDVARAAGVSPSTASRALTGHGYAAAPVKQRVLAAADRLGYVPDEGARSLKLRTSRLVGVVISDLRNQFYADLAAGVEQVLGAAGYQMVLVNDDGDLDRERAGARTLLAMRVRGAIITPLSAQVGSLLTAQGVHVVEMDRQMAATDCDAVLVDSERGALAATEHLLSLGHRRIAFLADELEWTTGAGRLAGYRAAFRAAGVRYDRSLVVRVGTAPADRTTGDNAARNSGHGAEPADRDTGRSAESAGRNPGHSAELADRNPGYHAEPANRAVGHSAETAARNPGHRTELSERASGTVSAADAAAALSALLAKRPDVTAVFAANNLMASGVWQELARRGSRVPEDVSLVAFDDLPWMSMVAPSVSAVSQPVVSVGARAAELLLARLSGELSGPPRTVRLPPTFVPRASTHALV